MPSNTLPPYGYLSDNSRTTSDMQGSSENFNSAVKELLGGTSESTTLSISSNVITPPNDAAVLPVDQTGGGVINLINVSNVRDGQVICVHSVNSSNPITITNMATATGGNIPIATFSGSNIILSNPAQFLQLKYSQSLELFQEFGGATDWGSPGAIGSVTPNTGSFTSISLTTALSVGNGGTGQSSLTSHGVLVGEGTSGVASVAPSSTSGYPLVSNGSSADPSFGQLSLDTAVTGTLPVANGGTGATSFTAHNLLVGEGSSLSTIAPSGTSGYPLVSNGSSTDPSFAQLNLASAVTGTLAVANGGTGAATFTAHGVLIGENTSAIVAVAPSSTSGYPLVSNGSSADPSFAQLSLTAGVSGSLPVANGGTGATSLTPHGVLIGEGTGSVVSVASSSSGYPLICNGSSTDPSFTQLSLSTAVTGTLPVANGGTGVTSLTAHNLLVGEGSSLSTIAPSSTSGYPLVSNGNSSDPSFAQLNLASAVTGTMPVSNGGTGATTFTAHGVLIGEGTGAVVSVTPSSSSGYPLVSNGSSSDPSFAQLNLALAVTGTLPIANGGTGATSFTAHGVLVGETAGAIVAVAPSSTSGYPLLSNGNSTDPSFAQLNLGTGVTGTLPIANGGTGATSFTSHGVIVGEGSTLSSVAPSSTSGYPLVSNGSSTDPSFAQLSLTAGVTGTLPVANGGTGATTLSAHGVLIGEGTGAVVSVTPSSSSGYPLVSNGSSSDPSFAQLNLASAVTGTLLVANGGTGAATSAAGTIFGNFGSSTSAPGFNSAGSNNQILGVVHSGSGLEWKSISAGANITVTPAAGSITIAFSNPLTTLGDTIYGGSSGALTRLAGSMSATKSFLTQTGTGSASAAPSWGTIGTSDLPSSVVTSTGNLSPLFTSSIASQALSFSLSNAGAGTIFGNFSTSSGAPAYQSSGSANQVLGVQTSGTGLEYKSIVAGTGVTVTPSAGQIQISSTSASFPLANQCRLYGVSGSPYADTDTASPPLGAQSLFFGPCFDRGNSIFLYSSTTSSWGRVAASETSVGLTSLTAGDTYDVYVYNNSGSVAIEFSAAWSGDTSPLRDIQDGVLVKHGDPTRLYVGSIEVYSNTHSPPQLSVASYPGYRGIWNAYNRIQSPLNANDTTAASWGATGAWRIAHGLSDTSYGYAVIRIVTGAQIEAVSLNRYVKTQPDAYTDSASFGIAIDSGSSTPAPLVEGVVYATSYTAAGVVTSSVPYTTTQLGGHVYESVELTSGGANFFSYTGTSPKIPLSGMTGTTWW